MDRRVALGALGGLIALALMGGTACSHSHRESPSERRADGHAATAGLVMERYGSGRPPMSLNDAAWQVVGTGSDDAIQAMLATGTTYSGEVILRITVQGSEFDESTTCYRYNFTHSMSDDKPIKLGSCPSGAPVALKSPVPEPVVDTPARINQLTALLNRLTAAQLADPSSVQSLLRTIFPAPIGVYADRLANGTLQIGASTFDTCITAYVTSRRQVTVHPGHGADCHGG